tara:strand:+ start:573 stop:1208 length:636 start_codon:yes stop_codon:yes gene_type:complete
LTQLWIKICGITKSEDASSLAKLDIDAIGLIFYKHSSRAISCKQLPEILENLSDSVKTVGLFVDPSRSEVDEVVDTGLIDILQFHGSEPEGFCSSFDRPYIKAIHVKDKMPQAEVIEEYSSATLLLLDTYNEKESGGTGEKFDWSIAKKVIEGTDQRVVLAGGLNPGNIGHAISSINPFGVDVSSGVELSPGQKDLKKVWRFIREARSVRS